MGNVRPPINKGGAQNPLLPNSELMHEKKTTPLCRLCAISTTLIISVLLLIFILVFVAFPLYFKNSIDLQRSFIFQTDDWPTEPEYTNFAKYAIDGVQNLYVNLDDNVSLGVWHILPEAMLVNHSGSDFNFSALLVESDYPVLLYFHGNAGNRIGSLELYLVLRQFFHIIAFDYRGFADSTNLEPSEDAIVRDSVQVYKWLRSQTDLDIYFWGHSLGSALCVHTIANLQAENIVPTGLFLEAPFSSLEDVIRGLSIAKIFTWLPWFESTILEPLEENGFKFKTVEYIRQVDCPIMIIHAMDDDSVPYALGEKLYQSAQSQRDLDKQGNVTLHLIPGDIQCGHMELYRLPELTTYISDHISICKEYNIGRG